MILLFKLCKFPPCLLHSLLDGEEILAMLYAVQELFLDRPYLDLVGKKLAVRYEENMDVVELDQLYHDREAPGGLGKCGQGKAAC